MGLFADNFVPTVTDFFYTQVYFSWVQHVNRLSQGEPKGHVQICLHSFLFSQLSVLYLSKKSLNLSTFIVPFSALQLQYASQFLFLPGFTLKGTNILTDSNSCYGKKSS